MLKWSHNFDVIAEIAGTVQGASLAEREQIYLDGLATHAHTSASIEFDREAAAMGAAGGLRHVYEFGVAGITPGTPRVGDPTSAAARLWIHQLTGDRGDYEVRYTFRPATIPNPRPTTASTGVPSKYLARLSRRKYLFWNKAYVMETGSAVKIGGVNGPLIFVPFYGQPPEDGKNTKGYMMFNTHTHGKLISDPGRNSAGKFQAFFETWWGSIGQEHMVNYVETAIPADTAEVIKMAQARAAKQKPEPTVSAAKSSAVAKAASQLTVKHLAKKGAKRSRRKRK